MSLSTTVSTTATSRTARKDGTKCTNTLIGFTKEGDPIVVNTWLTDISKETQEYYKTIAAPASTRARLRKVLEKRRTAAEAPGDAK
jgi:hypothetical protein